VTRAASPFVIETFPVGILGCNCTILGDAATKEAIVVDPGDDAPKVLARVAALGLRTKAILITHTHIDHVGGNHEIRETTGARLMLHERDLPLYDNLDLQARMLGGFAPPLRATVDEHIHQGDVVKLGGHDVHVLHTPGHTPGSCCFYLEGASLLLAGDTLFQGSIGRTDLWGGDFDEEIRSIRSRLLVLPDSTRVIAGHGSQTSIGNERTFNPFLSANGR
jgi:glyoxylase-like metal-dependent hydrolase (beta-lactamase superfamily II)